jgi:hypothetical protein
MSNHPEAYWIGVADSLSYFKNELGIEDAYQTRLADWVRENLGKDYLSDTL